MPEETETQTTETQGTQETQSTEQQAAENIQPEVLESGTLAALKGLSGFLSPETQSEIDNASKKPENKEEKPEIKEEVEEKKSANDKPAEKKEDKKTEEAVVEEGKKSVLGLNKKADKKNEVVIESPEQILEVVKSKFGQDIKDIKGLPKFFESVENWRKDSQKAETLENENKQFKKLWEEELPQEFLDAATIHLKGGDYREAFAGIPKFDFNKKAEKQDTKELVQHYFPGEFSEEDFEESEPAQGLKIATKAAIDKFNVEKQMRESQRAAIAEKSQKLYEAQKTSVTSSVKALKQRFPDMESDTLNEVKSILEGGKDKVLSLLYNNDGTVKQDAAVRLTMALYGEDEIQSALKKETTKIETKVNEEILSRGADGPKPKQQSTGAAEKIDPEIKKQIDDLKRATKQNTF